MTNLIEQITAANAAYAAGMPVLTDPEYDILWQELRTLDPFHPLLYHTSQDPNLGGDYTQHLTPIYGTQKAFNMEDLKPFLQRFGTKDLQIEPKYDGVAGMIYNDPDGRKLILHGNGLTGRDISYHLPHCRVKPNPFMLHKESVELIIRNCDWNPDYGKNPRNTVAGWLNQKEVAYPSNVITIISHTYPQNVTHVPAPHDLDELHTTLLRLYDEWKAIYPIDGLMIKLADPTQRLIAGHNGTVSLWSVAWKPPISTAVTTVTDIHWNVSRQGKVVPTIEYQAVDLCGTTNTMVTGNNAKWIRDNRISPGATITIGKAGEIIPKIISVTPTNSRTITPTNCPECGSWLTPVGVHLTCDAPNCIAQKVRRIAYFYSDKGIEVKSIGEKMIFELFSDPTLKFQLTNRPWLLLDPKEPHIMRIERIWGTKRMMIYLRELDNSNARYNAAHFIAALGYPALAYKSALKCFQQLKGLPIRGSVPHKAVESFSFALSDLMRAKHDLTNYTLQEIPGAAVKTYCITGTLSIERNDMKQYLSQHKWEFTNQVSRHTDYLILGDTTHETTKTRKAAELNVTVIKEHDIPTLIAEQEKDNDTIRNEANSPR